MPSFQDVALRSPTLEASERIRPGNRFGNEMVPEDWPLPSIEWVAEVQRRSAEYDVRGLAGWRPRPIPEKARRHE